VARPCSPYGSKDHSLRTSDEGGSKGQLYSWWYLLCKHSLNTGSEQCQYSVLPQSC
jgi:hypothetical protein